MEIEDPSGGSSVRPNEGGDSYDKIKRADLDSTVDLACEFSSGNFADLKWRKLDGVCLLNFSIFLFYFFLN